MKHSYFFFILADPIDIRKLVCIQNEIKTQKITVQETRLITLTK